MAALAELLSEGGGNRVDMGSGESKGFDRGLAAGAAPLIRRYSVTGLAGDHFLGLLRKRIARRPCVADACSAGRLD
jgi:hypothetical protein